jgi:nucleotide-binding universal stress UspA family protein
MIIRSGEAAEEIIKTARDIKADLIVVGAQGKSTVEQFFLGSVSHKLSLYAPCSTVVVK